MGEDICKSYIWLGVNIQHIQITHMLLLLLSHFSHVWLVWPHWRQPTRLPCPWDSPGKNIGVGCHFLLQCMKVKSENEVVQLCLTLRDPMDYSLLGSSVHGIFQAGVLEWVAIAFSNNSYSSTKNENNPNKKWAEGLSRHFPKKTYRWPIDTWKDVQHH